MTIKLWAEGPSPDYVAWPVKAMACLLLAHGAGVGMTHKSMIALAEGLAARHCDVTLPVSIWSAALGGRILTCCAGGCEPLALGAARLARGLPLFAGGRSYGGRMTPLRSRPPRRCREYAGLVYFAFLLHSAGKPSTGRADHLGEINIPMLCLQERGMPWPTWTSCSRRSRP